MDDRTPGTKSRLGATAWLLVAVVFGAVALGVSVIAVQKALLPYNDEGNHFDGLTVHHAGSEFVYGAVALGSWALAVAAGGAARRRFGRAAATAVSTR